MLVLVGLISVFVVVRNLNRDDPPSPVRAVDYAQTAKFARAQAGFDLVAPASLPAGWKATTVSFTDGLDEHWHLGQLTDSGRYVGLEQGDASVKSMVTTYVDPDPVRGESVRIDGTTWDTWSDAGGDRALVLRDGATTTLVVGTATQDVLVSYVESLR